MVFDSGQDGLEANFIVNEKAKLAGNVLGEDGPEDGLVGDRIQEREATLVGRLGREKTQKLDALLERVHDAQVA